MPRHSTGRARQCRGVWLPQLTRGRAGGRRPFPHPGKGRLACGRAPRRSPPTCAHRGSRLARRGEPPHRRVAVASIGPAAAPIPRHGADRRAWGRETDPTRPSRCRGGRALRMGRDLRWPDRGLRHVASGVCPIGVRAHAAASVTSEPAHVGSADRRLTRRYGGSARSRPTAPSSQQGRRPRAAGRRGWSRPAVRSDGPAGAGRPPGRP